MLLGEDMKKCTICKTDKPIDEYNKNKTRKDGYSTVCRECNKEVSKKYYNLDKKRHIINVGKRNKKVRKENIDYINSIKSVGCRFCPEDDVCCLDFHHLVSEEKENCIARLTAHSIETIQKEIEKCVVICSNCHRKLHAGKIKLE